MYGLLILLCCIKLSIQHGYLAWPPNRSSLWRYGYRTPKNYNDNSLYCGGRMALEESQGKCGVCGDPFYGIKEHEAGGKFASGIITEHYPVNIKTITVSVKLTVNHRGYFEFRLCPHNDIHAPVRQECFNEFLLPIIDNAKYKKMRYYPKEADGPMYNLTLQIPHGIICSQCILQWRYHTGNSWGLDSNGSGCIGCGLQEEFYNCADISIGLSPMTKDKYNIVNLRVMAKDKYNTDNLTRYTFQQQQQQQQQKHISNILNVQKMAKRQKLWTFKTDKNGQGQLKTENKGQGKLNNDRQDQYKHRTDKHGQDKNSVTPGDLKSDKYERVKFKDITYSQNDILDIEAQHLPLLYKSPVHKDMLSVNSQITNTVTITSNKTISRHIPLYNNSIEYNKKENISNGKLSKRIKANTNKFQTLKTESSGQAVTQKEKQKFELLSRRSHIVDSVQQRDKWTSSNSFNLTEVNENILTDIIQNSDNYNYSKNAKSPDQLYDVTNVNNTMKMKKLDKLNGFANVINTKKAKGLDKLYGGTHVNNTKKVKSLDKLNGVAKVNNTKKTKSLDKLHGVANVNNTKKAKSLDKLYVVANVNNTKKAKSLDKLYGVANINNTKKAKSLDKLYDGPNVNKSEKAKIPDQLYDGTTVNNTKKFKKIRPVSRAFVISNTKKTNKPKKYVIIQKVENNRNTLDKTDKIISPNYIVRRRQIRLPKNLVKSMNAHELLNYIQKQLPDVKKMHNIL